MVTRHEGWIDELRRDATYACRALRGGPGFAVFSVLLLALGIGSSTLVFSVVNGLLLRPLPFAAPNRLAVISTSSGARLSAGYFSEWRDQTATFDDLAAWYDERAAMTAGGRPIEVNVDRATTNLFAVLRAAPLLGRTFSTERSLATVGREAILSYGFWQRQFGGDAQAIGRAISIDGEPVTIVGVMPRSFAVRTNELPETQADLWLPFQLVAADHTGMGGALNVIGRLKPDPGLAAARADISAIASRVEAAYPSYSRDWSLSVTSLREATVANVRPRLLLVFGGVVLLLLISCVSVATLLVSRNVARQEEWAIRTAIGATPARLLRQVVIEGAVLASAGTVCGVLIAAWGVRAFVASVPASFALPRTREMGVDAVVAGFAVLLTGLTALICGLLPGLSVARRAPQLVLNQTSRSASASRRSLRLSSALVVSQIAVAVILVTWAGLLGRSFLNLSITDAGFRPENVVTFRMTFPESKYDRDRVRTVLTDLMERLRAASPMALGFADYLPMTNAQTAATFTIAGRPVERDNQPASVISIVGGDYFKTLAIPIRRGRVFDVSDTDKTQPVFVIDERLAEKFWRDTDPIGARVKWQLAPDRTLEGPIVGVVGAVRWTGMASPPSPTTYCWFPQAAARDLSFVVRTAEDIARTRQLVSNTIAAVDADQPATTFLPMRSFVAADLAQPRFTALLSSGFAALAMLIAAIGMHAIMAGRVARRSREISIRVALGARPAAIAGLVFRDAMWLLAAGLGVGAPIAMASSRLLGHLLYGIVPTDMPTWIASITAVAFVGFTAVLLPAATAMKVPASNTTSAT